MVTLLVVKSSYVYSFYFSYVQKSILPRVPLLQRQECLSCSGIGPPRRDWFCNKVSIKKLFNFLIHQTV